MVNVMDLYSETGMKYVAYGQVLATFGLAWCGFLSSPDTMLIILLCISACGNFAWCKHIDEGWGSANAKLLFQATFLLSCSALVFTIYNRFQHPELLKGDDSDSEDEDDLDENGEERTYVQYGDVLKKDKQVKELLDRAKEKEGGGKKKSHSKKKNKDKTKKEN